jgi:hypothetical protein
MSYTLLTISPLNSWRVFGRDLQAMFRKKGYNYKINPVIQHACQNDLNVVRSHFPKIRDENIKFHIFSSVAVYVSYV